MRKNELIMALKWGLIWGILEATLGGALRYFPYRGAIMSNIALGLISTAIAQSRTYRIAPIIGLIAACIKLTDAFIFGVPVFSKVVFAPATAILIESVIFALVFNAMGFLRHKRVYITGPVAILAAFAVISPLFVSKGYVSDWVSMFLKTLPSVGISIFVCPIVDHLTREATLKTRA